MTNRINTQDLVHAVRNKLLSYCCYINQDYEIARHLILCANALERIERGDLKRLIVTMPPRHGKTQLISKHFTAWHWGRNPRAEIVAITHSQTLSDNIGLAVRDQIKSPAYQAIFPNLTINKATNSMSRLESLQKGSFRSVGMEGQITGFGATLMIIDDLVANSEQAKSKTIKEKNWEWFKTTASSRFYEKTALIIVMTRWDEEDLVGKILEHDNTFEVLNLPALDEHDRPLWPERFSFEFFDKIRRQDPFAFSCLYQGNPLPDKGGVVEKDWIKSGVDDENNYRSIMIAVDPAVGLKEINDETAIVVGGKTRDNPHKIIELETVSGHFNFVEIVDHIVTLAGKYRANAIGVEDVQAQRWLIQALGAKGLTVFPLKAHADKTARAKSHTYMWTQDRIRINTNKLKEQLLKFKGGNERNDLADAFFHMLTMFVDHSDIDDDDRAAYTSNYHNPRKKYLQKLKEKSKIRNYNINGIEYYSGSDTQDDSSEYY